MEEAMECAHTQILSDPMPGAPWSSRSSLGRHAPHKIGYRPGFLSRSHFGPEPWPLPVIPAGTAGIQSQGREPEPELAKRPGSGVHEADGGLVGVLNAAFQGWPDKTY